jgi:hypothetical protein
LNLLIVNNSAQDEAGGEVFEVPVRAMHSMQMPVRDVAVSRKIEADAVVIVVIVVVDAVAVSVMMVPVAVMEILPVPAVRGMPAPVMLMTGRVSALIGEMPAPLRAVAPALMPPIQVTLAVAIAARVVAAAVVMAVAAVIRVPVAAVAAVMQPLNHAADLLMRRAGFLAPFPSGLRDSRLHQQKQAAEYSGQSVCTHILLRQRVFPGQV